MTSLKTVLLGSAAGLLAVGAAQAADLPVKRAAAAVQYVEVCPVYGAGFYKLPGTDICIRHFGSMKFNFGFQNEREAWDPDGPGFLDPIVEKGASNTVGWQWTIRPGWDFRSPTEYGTLRAVVQMRVDMRNGVFENDDPVLTGAQRVNNMIHRGYIEWAGFLIGKAGTQFTYWDQDDVVTAIGGDPKESPPMQVTYVFTGPGGIKATLGLEDSNQWDHGFIDATTLVPGGVNGLGPQRLYDIVGTLGTEQSWGSAKIAGLVHFGHTWADINGNGAGDKNEQHVGWAVLGGITFNLPMLGQKDQLLLQAQYCDGAIGGCGVNAGSAATPSSFERGGQFLDGLQRRWDVDAVIVNDGANNWDFQSTKVWSVEGQLRHYWSPLWRSNLMASYVDIDVPRRAAQIMGVGDANTWDVAANLIWGQSRKTAEIGVEVVYKQLDQTVSNPTRATANALGVDTSPSGWAVVGFIQRAW
jgi:hypothetical protein